MNTGAIACVLHRVVTNTVLWQAPDSIAFVARGREHRSEFHDNPSDEVMCMIKGDMDYCPAGTPHSPRFSPDSFVL